MLGIGREMFCKCLCGNTIRLGAPVWERFRQNAGGRVGGRALQGQEAALVKRSVADHSWKEVVLAPSLAIHYAWGTLGLFLTQASSRVASYRLPL